MTNIGSLGSIVNQAISKASSKSSAATSAAAGCFTETSFDSCLDIGFEASEQTSPTEKIGAPDRWTSKPFYRWDDETLEGYRINEDALTKVREQLKAEGISPDSRTPTHEITDEQMEWLTSRYDFGSVAFKNYTSPDFGNFMLDLAYLNVFSLDEVRHFLGVQSFNVNHKGYLYKMDTGDGISGYVNPFGGMGNYLSDEELQTDLIMEYLRVKCSGHTEKEYRQMTEDYIAQRRERFSILEDFFARAAAGGYNSADNTAPKIENIAYRLHEDFGGLI